jgi:hypothetical protein
MTVKERPSDPLCRPWLRRWGSKNSCPECGCIRLLRRPLNRFVTKLLPLVLFLPGWRAIMTRNGFFPGVVASSSTNCAAAEKTVHDRQARFYLPRADLKGNTLHTGPSPLRSLIMPAANEHPASALAKGMPVRLSHLVSSIPDGKVSRRKVTKVTRSAGAFTQNLERARRGLGAVVQDLPRARAAEVPLGAQPPAITKLSFSNR